MSTHIRQDNRASILASVDNRVAQIVAKAAFDVEANAKVTAPIDTGFLRNSLQAAKEAALHWRVNAFAEYAAYVEMGTVHQGAKPFLKPALDKVRPTFIAALRKMNL